MAAFIAPVVALVVCSRHREQQQAKQEKLDFHDGCENCDLYDVPPYVVGMERRSPGDSGPPPEAIYEWEPPGAVYDDASSASSVWSDKSTLAALAASMTSINSVPVDEEVRNEVHAHAETDPGKPANDLLAAHAGREDELIVHCERMKSETRADRPAGVSRRNSQSSAEQRVDRRFTRPDDGSPCRRRSSCSSSRSSLTMTSGLSADSLSADSYSLGSMSTDSTLVDSMYTLADSTSVDSGREYSCDHSCGSDAKGLHGGRSIGTISIEPFPDGSDDVVRASPDLAGADECRAVEKMRSPDSAEEALRGSHLSGMSRETLDTLDDMMETLETLDDMIDSGDWRGIIDVANNASSRSMNMDIG